MKLWEGRFHKALDPKTNDFNSSIAFDNRMYPEDIEGSIAHATMLGVCGIIDPQEAEKICEGLRQIRADLDSGALLIDPNAEDIHTFVEGELTARLGDAGKRLHTARSRNDQVALDLRMTLRKTCGELTELLCQLVGVLADKAEKTADMIMPGYTHLQRAQPITFGHHLLAYAEMFLRDIGRMQDALHRMNECPLGSGALAGTTYPIDRFMTAKQLGFDAPCANSLDGVADRDFCVEIAAAISLCMVHLSRFSEEIILWCSWEYRFVHLDDAYSTGSSIMPQKKNPDVCELIRGKSGRVFGDLMTLLSMQKGLSLAYNKDMQEDKEALFDVLDTVKHSLQVLIPMFETMRFNVENMKQAALGGFINATDCADYLTKKGVPFRDAYRTIGELVAWCIAHRCALNDVELDVLKQFHPLFEEDVYTAIDLQTCVAQRKVPGGPAPEAVQAQISALTQFIGKEEEQNA